MATIPINNRYRLSADSFQWTLEERSIGERQEDGQDKRTGQTWQKGEKYDSTFDKS